MARILIVEDNEMNRDMLSRRLIRHGYEIIIAVDGKEAVDTANSQQIDLILMDLSLPIMDGWEATQHIKNNPQTKTIPIIALTAHALSEDRQKALQSGCDEYEIKPLDFPKLLSKIEMLL